MEKSNLQKLQEESDVAFRDQFDPASENYHGGSKEIVPVGGDRVPEEMYSMYPEGLDPNKPAEIIDYGEQYRTIESQRTTYQNLKKTIAKLCPVVQSFLRHDQIFKEKGDPKNQKHLQIHEQNIQKQKQNLKVVQKELEVYIPQLQAGGETSQGMAKQLIAIIEASNKKYDSKETLGDFNFQVKKLSTQTFSAAQKNLQRMKDIKKAYAIKQKQEEQSKKKQQTTKQKEQTTEKKEEQVPKTQ